MRSNRSYSLREHFSAIRKFIITKLSLLFLKIAPNSSLTVIRDGGLGDAIMATGLIVELERKYPKAEISVSVSFPELFLGYKTSRHSFFSFPVIWLSYTHYDFFPWTLGKPLHCRSIMAKLAGLEKGFNMPPILALDEIENADFIKKYIDGKSYLVIQPSAGEWFLSKNWSNACWEELVEKLSKRDISLYQIGTMENPLIKGVLDFRGQTTIYQSFLLIKHATALIGVNSFAEQVAWVFNVPSVILYGPTNPIYSLNPGQTAVYSNQITNYGGLSGMEYTFSDMRTISVETVLKALEQIEPRY